MAAIKLLQSPRLTLVNSVIENGLIKAGWVYSLGLLGSVEPVQGDGQQYQVSIPEFMQQDPSGGELFEANDTIDFFLANGQQ
ncbi:hypothetical protein N836_31340 [Leptolyngbya sp. Heron Island J]|uniref:hypothetical protein n=1 Tax=Leptolyngbya sp. Heron Island J TaxID=1385935 RepID=UPI0003B96310|nr:hypothetical protein [Leptolyngbya sp. Heron Island J]ESA38436.1 hypothetical protein N836_31340 [Leptolyngbya sp. Heron Island J]